MKVVLSWLRESCPTDLSAEELAELLTRKGAEATLRAGLARWAESVRPAGAVWVCWPKKASTAASCASQVSSWFMRWRNSAERARPLVYQDMCLRATFTPRSLP